MATNRFSVSATYGVMVLIVVAAMFPPAAHSEDESTSDNGQLRTVYRSGSAFSPTTLTLNDDSTYCFTWHSCVAGFFTDSGVAKVHDGVMTLRSSQDRQSRPPMICAVYRQVAWGDATYLVPDDRLFDFVNAVNSRDFRFMAEFLADKPIQQDEPMSVRQPDLPVRYKKVLLPVPIDAVVVAIGKSRLKPWVLDSKFRVTEVTLNVGREDGVFERMAFHLHDPELAETALVTEVREHESTARIKSPSDRVVPRKGWRLSSDLRRNSWDRWP